MYSTVLVTRIMQSNANRSSVSLLLSFDCLFYDFQVCTVVYIFHPKVSHPSTQRHHMSRIPFLILSSLDFVVFVVTTLIFHENQRKCAISSTNVAILLLLFKRAIIAPNKLIDSQSYKRHKETTTIEFHSPSHFTLTITQ